MKRKIQLNLTCPLLILLAVVLGCSDSGSSDASAKQTEKKIPAAYVGMWTGADGSTLTIRNDGSGDYKSGGNSMSGGSVEVDETAKEIRFSLLLFDSKYKIDESPKDNKMKLDGMEYRRTGGFEVRANEQESVGDDKVEVPSDAELRLLAGETIRLLDDALQRNNFEDFHASLAEALQKKYTAAEFRENFGDTVSQKDRYKLKEGEPLVFRSRPALRDDNRTFDLFGSYQTTIRGRSVPFQLRYLRENGDWKLLGIYLNPDKPPKNEK